VATQTTALEGVAALPDETVSPAGRDRRASGPQGRAARWSLWVVVAALSALFVYPFIWLVSASLKPRADVFNNALVPHPFAPKNYVTVWDSAPILRWLLNSVVVGLSAAIAVTISSAFVAFGFAYFRFRGRGVLFGLVLATMMLPAAVTLVPTYLIWNKLGLSTTQVPLWAGNLFGSAFYIFLIRQFFLSLPRELFEAARVDGLGYLGMFWRIAVPLSKPALIITFIFELRSSWTDLMKPLIYVRDIDLFTLPRGLQLLVRQFDITAGGEGQMQLLMAAAVIVTLPMIVVFFLGQRYFVEGIATTGRKG
jgi:multiple sugar transport system permease protein